MRVRTLDPSRVSAEQLVRSIAERFRRTSDREHESCCLACTQAREATGRWADVNRPRRQSGGEDV